MLHIRVDTREKRPLIFPAHLPCLHGSPLHNPSTRIIPVTVTSVTMDVGDYGAEGSPVVIERKGSIEEVWGNVMTADRLRFMRCLDRLSGCGYPVLLLEGTPGDLLSPTPRCKSPHLAVDSLVSALLERGISLMILPTQTQTQRRAAGEMIARLLHSSIKTPSLPSRAKISSPHPAQGSGGKHDSASERDSDPKPAEAVPACGNHRPDLRGGEA